MTLKDLQKDEIKYIDKEIEIKGWIRNHRPQKEFGFIDFSDGTSFKHLQVVYTKDLKDFDKVIKLHNGSSIKVVGDYVKSEGSGQAYELKAKTIELLGDCPEDYPLQPKKHSMEFLRSIAYLRPRANTFQAVFKVRSVAAYAIHKYFQDRNYIYVHTPLLTTADCEGSDQMFKVSTFDFDNLPKKDGKVDFSKDLFNEIEFFDKFVEKGLKEKLEKVVNSSFVRIDHKDVIDLLKNSGEEWEFTPDYDDDIAKEHEKWLTKHFNGPVFVKNWPKDIKAYYMKLNSDGKTVAAVDLEVPGAGELMGGSQREENLDVLLARMEELGADKDTIDWYLNLRRYGGCIHSGFGMGFERLIMYLTGIENIRDVIPYPRTPGSCEF